MKLSADLQFQTRVEANAWERLKQFTDARIALGRVEGVYPTQPSLAFQLAHAQAKDAVLKPLDIEGIRSQLTAVNTEVLQVESSHRIRDIYLKRPDLAAGTFRGFTSVTQRLCASQTPILMMW